MHITDMSNGNEAGENTAGLNEIRTSGDEDQKEKAEAMAGNGESSTFYSVEL